jgi:CrcB protein
MSASDPPIDPDFDADIDLGAARRHGEPLRVPWATLGVISAGGALGALARYGVGAALPHARGAFAWSTFLINVSGCLLIGVLMVLITEGRDVHPLIRPFFGVGVLGGYTTFSGFVVDAGQALRAGAAATALAYLVATLVAALTAVTLGAAMTRRTVRLLQEHR